MKLHIAGLMLATALTVGGCTAHLSAEDQALLESSKSAAAQAQQSATAAAASAAQAAKSEAAAAQSAADAKQSADQADAIFKKLQHK